MNDLRVRFTESSNDYMQMQYSGSEGILHIADMAKLVDAHGDMLFRTSLLESAQMEGDELVLKTLNSVYRFKLLSGTLLPEHIVRIKNNQDIAAKLNALNENERSNTFVCTVGGTPEIEGARSIVRLPSAMNRAEALEYLKENVLRSISGDIVVYINQPLNNEQLVSLGYDI